MARKLRIQYPGAIYHVQKGSTHSIVHYCVGSRRPGLELVGARPGTSGANANCTLEKLPRYERLFEQSRARLHVELWNPAPHLHGGSAATVGDVLTTRSPKDHHGQTSTLTADETDDLCAMLSLQSSLFTLHSSFPPARRQFFHRPSVAGDLLFSLPHSSRGQTVESSAVCS